MNLLNLYYWVLQWIRQIAGAVFPLFRTATDFAGWGRWAWHTVHVIAITLILAGLWYIGNKTSLEEPLDRLLRSQRYYWLRSSGRVDGGMGLFLPLLFLLIYALSWVLRWIWLQLGPEAELNEFPDITTAWVDGLARLSSKGVKPADLPLFLIMGQSKAGEEFLFQAGKVPIEVFGPSSGDPPLRLWASRDAIYVTCPGASSLGTYAELLYHGPNEDMMSGANREDMKKTIGIADEESLDANQQEIRALLELKKLPNRPFTA